MNDSEHKVLVIVDVPDGYSGYDIWRIESAWTDKTAFDVVDLSADDVKAGSDNRSIFDMAMQRVLEGKTASYACSLICSNPYECIGKGGKYDVIGVSRGAGTSRHQLHVIYKCVDTGLIFHRDYKDFSARMRSIAAIRVRR